MSAHHEVLGLIDWRLRTNDPQPVLSRIPLMLVADEVAAGTPAGDLLTAMLAAIKLTRDQIEIVSPSAINERLQHVQPDNILCMGELAATALDLNGQSLEAMRGKTFSFGERAIPFIVTYHPSHLLAVAADKRGAWQDLQRLTKI